jgi:DNA-binding NtrC family response regulator
MIKDTKEVLAVSKKIAFIDDEKGVLESIKWVFKNEPYQIFTFLNPVEALEKIEQDEFAVVVADQVMPEMEGTSLLDRIKKRWPGTECIIMTAHDNLIDDLKKITDRVITKPWDVGELRSIIKKAVSIYEAGVLKTGAVSMVKKTILYVENDDFIIEVVDQIMRRLGYGVILTTRCSEAIRLMEARPDMCDLVITDMKMPDMNGLELSRKLTEIRPDIPIILCTGQTDLTLDSSMKAAGIRAILPKPFGVDDIAMVIRDVLGDSGTPERQ